MLSRVLALIPAAAFSLPALAAADLSTTLTAPASQVVYVDGTYTVSVKNVGNKTAYNVSVVIDLPETHTSPSVYVMGDVGAMSGSCSQSGTAITCNLGSLGKGRTSTVSFDIALPWSDVSLDFTATASTTSSESNTSNNADSASANATYIDAPISAPATATNSHCTGTGLTGWLECTSFPRSITAHDADFAADGTISFPGQDPLYTGEWQQGSDDELSFQYYYDGSLVADFYGNGVSSSCFEGLTLFTGSSYVAPYEVCF